MKTWKVGWLLAAALVLQACAAGPTREAARSDADELIHGVMTQEQLSCPKYTTMVCTGSGRVNLQCGCANPEALQMTLSGYY